MLRLRAPTFLLLVAFAAVAQAQCNLPFWSTWKQADLSVDPQPRELAIDSLRDYLAGLEQASSDFKCSSREWNGDGLQIKSACFEPTATNGQYQYAISFSYSIQCRVTDILVNVDGQDTSEDTPVTLSGNVDGAMPAKRVPVGVLSAAAASQLSAMPAQEPAVEAANGPGFVSTSTRIIAILISTSPRGQATADKATLPGLPLPENAIGVMAVSVSELRNGLCRTGAPPLPVAELTISEAHAAFSNGTLTCSNLVNAYLQRIYAFDTRTGLNAISTLNPDAQDEAEKLDILLQTSLKANSSAGVASSSSSSQQPVLKLLQDRYPLFCVPILVKDNFDVQGMPTTAGNIALLNNYPRKDAVVVERLKAAGAIILAKSSMGELALFPTFSVSSLGPGVVRNPYNLAYTPSGSSGGSAAGIAAGFALAAIGSDTGNSVRGPASHTSLVGLRPSIGLVSRSGLLPLRFDRDTVGPLTKSVEDTARLLMVMQGFDPGDNLTDVLSTNNNVNINYVQNLPKLGLKGVRIGVLAGLENLPDPDGEIFSLFTQAVADLAAAGATIISDFNISGNSLGTRDWDVNRGGEGPAMGQWFANGKYRDIWKCRWTIRAGFDQYIENAAINDKNDNINNTSIDKNNHNNGLPRNLRELFENGKYHPAAYNDLKLAVDDPVANCTVDQSPCQCETLEEDVCRVEFRSNLIKSMDRDEIDVTVFPTWSRLPLLIGQDGDGWYDGNNSPMIAPHTGSPAITVPMGFTEAGLPGGLQFLARPFDEAKLLQVAYEYEKFTKHRKPPPLFSECKDPLQGDGAAAAG